MTLEEREAAVTQCVEEARKFPHFTHYVNQVSGMPLLLHKHGLGQMLAYLQMRGGNRRSSPHELIFQQVARRLAQVYPLPGDNLLDHLTQVDSQQYRRLTEEAGAFLLRLRQALKEAKRA